MLQNTRYFIGFYGNYGKKAIFGSEKQVLRGIF
jgi:hypothetical protein